MFWYDVTEGKSQMNNGDEFIDGHTYRMEVHIKTVDGYVFAVDADGCPGIDAKINGMTAEVIPAVSNETATIAFEFTYEGESANPTDPVDSTDFTETTEPLKSPDTTDATEPSTSGDDKPIDSAEPSTNATEIPTDKTEPTEPESTPGESDPTTPVDNGILGDVNGDGKVNIKDTTQIQKYAAKLVTLTEAEMLRADVNADAKVNIKDATAIQKFTAKIETGLLIGEKID